MTKEEQRFQAAVAAMQALCTSEIPEEVAMRAITIADALIKELDKDSVDTSIRYIAKVNSFITRDDDKHGYYNHYFLRLVDCPICAVPDIIGMTTKYCSQCGSKIEWVIEENEPLPPYEKDLFANSKNGDGKKTHDFIVSDTVVTKANPDARVVTKTQITTQNRNSI
jgi:hypothetical protein